MTKTMSKKSGSNEIYMTTHESGGVYVMYSYLGGGSSEIAATATDAVEMIIDQDVWIGPKSMVSSSKKTTLAFLREAAKSFDGAK